MKIAPYPKRRRFTGPAEDLRATPPVQRLETAATVTDTFDTACYADFFTNEPSVTADAEVAS